MQNSVEAAQKNPVVLVHGFKDDDRKMQIMARYLRQNGWEAHTVKISPSWGQVGLEVLAKQLHDYIHANFNDAQKIDLVGFSMGGLICRYYVQRMDGAVHVQRLVTISSPHHGTLTANLLPNVGSRQMRPGSAFLRDLNDDVKSLHQVEFTSIWTPLDLMILPATSSRMPIGREVKLPVLFHPLMVWQSCSIRAVADALCGV